MSRYDVNPPIGVAWDSVLVRRTIDRKTGVVMAEDVCCSMDQTQLHRSFKGESPKEVLTVFFSWEETPTSYAMSVVASPGDKTRYDAISGRVAATIFTEHSAHPKVYLSEGHRGGSQNNMELIHRTRPVGSRENM